MEKNQTLRATWAEITRDRASLPPSLFMLYSLLRGKDARRGFTPIANPVKLANGQRAWQSYDQAKSNLHDVLRLGGADGAVRYPAFARLLAAAGVTARQVEEGFQS